MDAAAPLLDLAHASADINTVVLQSMSLTDRFTCALVCKAWAEAATAATRSIILRHTVQDLSCLQHWLEKHGKRLEVLQLHKCCLTALAALPCPQLQDLYGSLSIGSTVWTNIASATKLTSVSLRYVRTASKQADVLSALTALPDLQQLTWDIYVGSGDELRLSDSLLLKQLAKLTALQLEDVTAEALEPLGLLTKLQHLSVTCAAEWAAAGFPGLQELKALTSLQIQTRHSIPASVSQLTALQQLELSAAALTALNGLQALTSLTQLRVQQLTGLSLQSPPLLLPGLQHLDLTGRDGLMPMSFLSSCTRLRVLCVQDMCLVGPGSLVASNLLQRLELGGVSIYAGFGAAAPASWQQVFAAAGQLPHLTSMELTPRHPTLQHGDMEYAAATCSSIQALSLETLQTSCPSALMPLWYGTAVRLSSLTSLHLQIANDQQCSWLAQLTRLRELRVYSPRELSTAGLRQLAALEQLTSLGFGYKFDREKVSPEVEEQMPDRLPCCFYGIISKVRTEGLA